MLAHEQQFRDVRVPVLHGLHVFAPLIVPIFEQQRRGVMHTGLLTV